MPLKTSLDTPDQHMALGSSLRGIRQLSHQLKRGQVSSHVENVILPLLEGVDKENLQQRENQVEKQVENTASHQHPDNIGVDVGWRDLYEV